MTRAQATEALRAAGVDQPAREARLLLAAALDLPPGAVPDPAAPIPDGFAGLVLRRASREPMARIVGRQGFWTLDLLVSDATLIPRADSETLIEAAVATRPQVAGVLDLGTGTGALLLAALVEYPEATGVGIDRNPAACALAAENAARNTFSGRAMFVCADWAAPITGRFDLVLCNPPYIPGPEIAALMPEVAAYEPTLALDGGDDGLEAYRAILPRVASLLAPHGIAVFEHGAGQGDTVAALAEAAGLGVLARRRDLGGVARVLVLDDPKQAPYGTFTAGSLGRHDWP